MSSSFIKAENDLARMRHLISAADTRVREAFLQAIQTVKNQNNLMEVAALLEAGDIEAALRYTTTIGASVSSVVSLSVISAGEGSAAFVGRYLQVPMDFDQTNERAVSIMRENNLRLIQQFNDGQRLATQEALISGIRRGLNPRDQARNFRASIGLTQSQVRAVNNYRTLLQTGSREALTRQLRDRRFDRSVVNARNNGTVLSADKINRMVARYEQRYLIYRSEVIARTEALRAVHQGTEELYTQAFDSGELAPTDLERTWRIGGGTSKDGTPRTRDSHLTMNGQSQPVGVAFVSGNGTNLRYPGDIDAPIEETAQCRCIIATRFT